MSHRKPRSLLTQVAVLSFAALLVAQFVSFWLFTVDRAKRIRTAQRIEVVERSAAVAALLNKAPPAERVHMLEAASSRSTSFVLAAAPIVAEPNNGLVRADCEQDDCASGGLPVGVLTEEEFVGHHGGGRFTNPPSGFRDRLVKSGWRPSSSVYPCLSNMTDG